MAYFYPVTSTSNGQLISTGNAARLMGVSRQHIVDLCDDGRLDCVLVGTHRRVRLDDVNELMTAGRAMSREQSRSLLLGYAVAGKLVVEPDKVLEIARRNLDKADANQSRGATHRWIAQWRLLLAGPISQILETLTSKSEHSCEMRQNSPFAGVLSQAQRTAVLNNARNVASAR
jgi:excisionase family DNA binding protein